MDIVMAAPLFLSVSSLFGLLLSELTQGCGLTSLLVTRWVESAPVLSCLQIMHLCSLPLSSVWTKGRHLAAVVYCLIMQTFPSTVCLYLCLSEISVSLNYILVLYTYVLVFRDRISLCSFGACPETLSVDQAGLELTEICLSLPPECWD